MSRKRAAIIHTGKKLFLGKGISDVSMEQIAEAVPVSKMTLYNTFGNKEGLLDAVIDDVIAESMALFDRAVREASDPLDALNKLADSRFMNIEISEAFIKDLQSGYPQLMDKILETGMGQAMPRFEQLILEGQQKGQIRKDLSPIVVMSFLRFLKEYVSRTDALFQMGNIQTVKEQLTTIFYHGILVDPPNK
ncbi:TetR/AcrR family transcriptional regulator [Cohnella endophytica]|uniref:TetR/AcrR family transcriptional regulator n=1 Tax=Cohnella endophytica TaxID=2419778 RepID=A0A494XF52_9BACL|nr:TetR/AcrR family transcriptional regulator [Cohnella endophytica]RKP46724.1 TetR/AcrR family transcriptional regulator [Cohnella endophytica]